VSVAGGAVTLGADGNYSSSTYDNVRNFDSERVPSYSLFNAQIGWKSDDERFRLSAFVSNLTDKVYKTVGYDLSTLCGCSEVAYGKPRTWGISAGYSFK
jgi:iron complex outermembrane receptor protein